jgi:2-oxoisovalerate dehydrogenase E1 component beta subunit
VDYIFNTIDLLKVAGNTLWCTNGQAKLPLVVMSPVGAGIRGSVYHSHSFDAWASRLAGWKVVMPSTPIDAYGLLLAAIKDPNPVLFLKPKALMRVRGEELIPGEPANEKELKAMIDAPIGDRSKWKPQWPALQNVDIKIGQGRIVKAGHQLTVVSYGRHLLLCQEVAESLEKRGHSIEVIDLRSIYPYDWTMIKNSVTKTGRVLFVNEDTEVTNFGEHLAYRTTQELFYQLMASQNIPGIGLHAHLEEASVPQKHDIELAMLEVLNEVP